MNLFNFDKDNDYKETWEYKGSKEFYDRLMIYNRYFFDHKARSFSLLIISNSHAKVSKERISDK